MRLEHESGDIAVRSGFEPASAAQVPECRYATEALTTQIAPISATDPSAAAKGSSAFSMAATAPGRVCSPASRMMREAGPVRVIISAASCVEAPMVMALSNAIALKASKPAACIRPRNLSMSAKANG
ncbi:MAG TPA: hypothetical protein VFN88_09870, partial [Caulobacteraceae bacterium]|nr:hypothetical protein [Caulobacteraceae bacterium]